MKGSIEVTTPPFGHPSSGGESSSGETVKSKFPSFGGVAGEAWRGGAFEKYKALHVAALQPHAERASQGALQSRYAAWSLVVALVQFNSPTIWIN